MCFGVIDVGVSVTLLGLNFPGYRLDLNSSLSSNSGYHRTLRSRLLSGVV